MQQLISDFMYSFYGYGNTNGPYWFIGMEEGCGPDWDRDVKQRFETWDARGRQSFEDVREYHFALGIRKFWEATQGRRVKVQPTWRRLLETLLSAKGQAVTPINVAQLQAQAFGMFNSDTCLLELLPLPSPNIRGFGYEHLANEEYPFFASRRQYRKEVTAARILGIQERILTYKPRHVVLYGTTYAKDWSKLVNDAAWIQTAPYIKRSQIGDSLIWMVPHPVARQLPPALFVNLGVQMRASENCTKQGR